MQLLSTNTYVEEEEAMLEKETCMVVGSGSNSTLSLYTSGDTATLVSSAYESAPAKIRNDAAPIPFVQDISPYVLGAVVYW
ncbi:hypothetical protein V6N12_048422 [Hibiscus sabdariffa]|uniref:Uncharacterized protein n=1 Tax=Hibiscus sabdariffa TaxID=183260 RepID=A0ABR2EIQ0_9ROSI